MRLLILGHVDGDEVALAAVQGVGQCERRFGFADAGGAGQQEYAFGFARVFEAGFGDLDALRNQCECVGLADDTLFQQALQIAHGVDFIGYHAPERDAGPAGDYFGDGGAIDTVVYQWLCLVIFVELFLFSMERGA